MGLHDLAQARHICTCVVVKPGHKVVKEKWWALYYRKLQTKYHLRDNYLGRKINQWIERDLEPLKAAQPELFVQSAQGKPGRKPKIRVHPDGTPMKRRKPNSSKEGAMPAYSNVEMVQPAPKEDAEKREIERKLAACCVDGTAEWNPEQLDSDIAWFKGNRAQIMENIPSLTKGSKRKRQIVISGEETEKRPQTMESVRSTQTLPCGLRIECDAPWMKVDVHKTSDAYMIEIDLPGILPETDFIMQTDGNRLAIMGERKNLASMMSSETEEEARWQTLMLQRPMGPFSLQVTLPTDVNIKETFQTYSQGVLSIKIFPKMRTWRRLNVAHLSPEHPDAE
jgi:HSP20 family molecular chaperone IbpA